MADHGRRVAAALRGEATRLKARVKEMAGLWHAFWFQPADPINLGVLRWLAGGMLLYTHLVWSLHLDAFFGAQGWQSAELVQGLQSGSAALSFWWLVPDGGLWPAHLASLAVLFCFWIGWHSRVTSILSLAVVVSYANRAPLAMFGLDQINVMLTLYLCLGPSGAALSVDRWLLRRRAARRGETAPPPRPHPAARLSLRMIQCHLCVIYFWSGISKLQGVSWWNGEAIWRAAANFEYQQVPLTWLAYAPWLFQLATLSVWLWEISFPFLVWRPLLRPLVLLVGVAMHVGIGMFLGMWTFGLVMTFAYAAFLPPQFCHLVVGRLAAFGPAPPPEDRVAAEVPAAAGPPTDRPAADDLPAEAPGLPHGLPQGLPSPPLASAADDAAAAARRQGAMERSIADGLIVFMDRSTRRRCEMIRNLESLGYRCLGVDAWPECLAVVEALRPTALVFNGRRLQPSETAHWLSRLEQAGLPHWRIGLAEKLQLGAMERATRGWHVAWLALPAELDDLIELLGQKSPAPPAPSTTPAPAESNVKPRSAKRPSTPATPPKSIPGELAAADPKGDASPDVQVEDEEEEEDEIARPRDEANEEFWADFSP